MHEYIKYFDKIRIMLIYDSTIKQKMKVKKDFSIEAHLIANRRDRMIDFVICFLNYRLLVLHRVKPPIR
jgi:hypothetical protein